MKQSKASKIVSAKSGTLGGKDYCAVVGTSLQKISRIGEFNPNLTNF